MNEGFTLLSHHHSRRLAISKHFPTIHPLSEWWGNNGCQNSFLKRNNRARRQLLIQQKIHQHGNVGCFSVAVYITVHVGTSHQNQIHQQGYIGDSQFKVTVHIPGYILNDRVSCGNT